MKLIFIDEQYGKVERGKFTAITAAIFSEEIINEYRSEFVSGLAHILKAEKNTVINLPVIHGTELLKGDQYTDEQRVAVCELCCKLVREFGVEIIRLGYFDKSLLNMTNDMQKNPTRLGFVICNLELMLLGKFSENYIFLYELDKQNLEKTQYNDKYNADIYGQLTNPDDVMSIDYKKSLGRFYCSKENYCMYSSDLIGWLIYQSEKQNLKEFKKRVIQPLELISDRIKYNEIIWINDPTIRR